MEEFSSHMRLGPCCYFLAGKSDNKEVIEATYCFDTTAGKQCNIPLDQSHLVIEIIESKVTATEGQLIFASSF